MRSSSVRRSFRIPQPLACLLLLLGAWLLGAACGPQEEPLAPDTNTWAELRIVRRGITVVPPSGTARAPYPRERLADGTTVRVDAGGLAWIRHDGGTTLLVRGPARLRQRPAAFELEQGRVFVDVPPDQTAQLVTPQGPMTLAAVRASVEVSPGGAPEAYVLRGEVRHRGVRARAGERLVHEREGLKAVPAVAWEDWTGGLATTDRVPAPAPFGIGTVGARRPGEQGHARFPLAIQKLAVKVEVRGDFALTEVEQTFFNPSSEVVEGLYGFRTPVGATFERFGVDRGGRIAWGHVEEKVAAAAQYQSNVYAGSTEDPALLEWEAAGVYRARLYPIQAGETRRVVARYSEWLGRTGAEGERRLYVFPMAAEGAEESLPRSEEFTFTLDLGAARATVVRAGMAGVRRGNEIRVRAQDLVPRSDLAVELYDGGVDGVVGYRADHALALDSLPRREREAARDAVAKEPDYLVVPLRATDVPLAAGGLDLAIVIDASAATDGGSLALARAATGALLAHLGADDRVAVWVGADALRPVTPRSGKLSAVDPALRAEVGAALARVAPGGATDLGKMLGDAAVALDPARRGAVVYVGDGRPTVGELGLDGLRQRLAKLARPVRVYALAVGVGADLGILGGLSRGGFAVRVEDGFGAARRALELLEHAERPVWLGASVDLGPAVERVYPRDTSAWVADESVVLVGRLSGREPPKRVVLGGPAGRREVELTVRPLADQGDAARRWGLGRLAELLDEGAGPAAMVDLGSRQGLITPVTSLYVPTTRELASDYDGAEQPATREEEGRSGRPGLVGRLLLRRKAAASAPMVAASAAPAPTAEVVAAEVEDGASTRARGEAAARDRADEAAPPTAARPAAPRLAREVAPPAPAADSPVARAAALREASELGTSGVLADSASGEADAVAVPPGAAPRSRHTSLGQDAADLGAPGGAGLGLSGVGAGGGGEGLVEGVSLKAASAPGAGEGFGSGHGRLGATRATRVPVLRLGSASVEGGLPPEVIQRIVRQSYGRYRMCYEQGLARNPNLTGRVAVRFVIGPDGAVETIGNQGSDLPDADVVGCVVTSFRGLDFPPPEYGRVTVVYPILFAPDGGAAGTAAAEAVAPTLLVRVLPRVPILCGDAARVSLEERVALWIERLAQVRDQAPAVAAVYSRALRQCEASSPRERARLLALMLDAMSTVRGQVELWRTMRDQLGAADLLYRGILARTKTAAQIRELHDALGLRSVDPGVLAKTLAAAKEPRQRIAKLRALRDQFPDDLVLALRLLEALEDAGDEAGARVLAAELRARADAEAGVRTAVGELFLRLAGRANSAGERAAAIAEARRAFGEIVEFSPADPVARRRLGDLLRAHGWHAEARRQYETLAQLTPDDPAVALLIAAAAQGEGRLEEAVRWTEKGIDAGAPDVAQGPAITARTFATTFLAWGRLDAAAREKEREALAARARRLLKEPATKAARVTLTFTHPDFHPTLWSNALGAPMPAAIGDLTLGIAEAVVPLRDDAAVEVRVEPAELAAAGRLGVEAVLTVVFAELDRRERIVRVPIRYGPGSPAVQRFVLRGQEVLRG